MINISNILYYNRALLEQWFLEQAQKGAIYTDAEKLPYEIKGNLKELEEFGYIFDFNTLKFKP